MRLSRRKKKWLKTYFHRRHGATVTASKQGCRDVYLAVIARWQVVKIRRKLFTLIAKWDQRVVIPGFQEQK